MDTIVARPGFEYFCTGPLMPLIQGHSGFLSVASAKLTNQKGNLVYVTFDSLQDSNMDAVTSLFPGSLDGRRIFDLNYLIHQVKKVAKHGKNECGWMDVDMVREERHGLRSTFEFKCRECQLVFDLKTDDYQRKDFSTDVLSAAAEANVEFSSLTAILNAADIPFMSYFPYRTEKDEISGSGPPCVGGFDHPEAQNYQAQIGDSDSAMTYDLSIHGRPSEPLLAVSDLKREDDPDLKEETNETLSCNANQKRVKSRYANSVRCLFCGKVVLYRSLLIHFVRKHKDKEEVKKILSLQKNNPRRAILLRNVKRKCDVTFTGPSWKKLDPNYLPCGNCKNLYKNGSLYKHCITCLGVKGNSIVKMSGLLKISQEQESEKIRDFKIKILLGIRTEIVRNFINGDPILTEYGIHCMNLELKKGNLAKFSTVRSSLYMVVAVFFIMQQKHPSMSNILDVFDPKLWGAFIEAIHEYTKVQSTLRKLRQQFYKISRFAANQCSRLEINADLLYKWILLFKNNHIQVIRHSQRWKNLSWFTVTKKLAVLFKFAHDELRSSLEVLKVKGFDSEAFETLNYAAMLKIMSYNRNRVVDLEKILISDFDKRQVVTRNTDIWKCLDESEKFTAERCQYFEIRSKFRRSIPILLDSTVIDAVETILFLREKSGVSRENPYVFGELESSYFKINSAINKLATRCGVETSCTAAVIMSADLKKYVACMSHALSMNNSDVAILSNVLGHSNVATSTASMTDSASTSDDVMLRLAKLFRLLVALNEESIQDFKGMNIDDIDVEIDIGSSETLSKPYVPEATPTTSFPADLSHKDAVGSVTRDYRSDVQKLGPQSFHLASQNVATDVDQENVLPTSDQGHGCLPTDEAYQSSYFTSNPYSFPHKTIYSNPSLNPLDSSLNYNMHMHKQHYSNCRETTNQMHHPALISTMPYAAANDLPYYSPAQYDNEGQRSCMEFFGFQSGMQNRWPVQNLSSDLSVASKAHTSPYKRKMEPNEIHNNHFLVIGDSVKTPPTPRKHRSRSPNSKIKRIPWTPDEKQSLLEFFGPDIFIDQKLPSYYNCQKAIEKYECLHLRTKAQVKAFINNEQRKWKKRLDSQLLNNNPHVLNPESTEGLS
uniref:Mutator-like transposase domain-containing protein n=1 Tax=Lygus hesperus TaxID=30085 RepID=A0A146KUY5_LYGHE